MIGTIINWTVTSADNKNTYTLVDAAGVTVTLTIEPAASVPPASNEASAGNNWNRVTELNEVIRALEMLRSVV